MKPSFWYVDEAEWVVDGSLHVCIVCGSKVAHFLAQEAFIGIVLRLSHSMRIVVISWSKTHLF